ncbi:hypothetical protein [Schlesneria paludicola]|uniref:hypothetical protein n=1 Tax=Schlesneria paludicola TaxID=360056 RepID=UPI00029A2394|nr:hypothetical protein [Schlesneria paludicola]
MFDSIALYAKSWRTLAGMLLLSVVGGCGYAQYESRLKETKQYYAYLDRIEQSLAPKWIVPGGLMELRVPNQFILIPPPQPIVNENGTVEEPTIDPRQPDYVNLRFPELFGAWEGKFTAARPDGSSEDRKGYIYALCNYWNLSGDRAVDAGKFVEELKTIMSQSLLVDPTDEHVELQPTGIPVYQQQQSFDVCAFKGVEIDGAKYTFEVYSRANGSVIAVIVVALPEAMDSPQRVTERIPMMLGTLQFTKDPPRLGAEKSGTPQPAAAPAGF